MKTNEQINFQVAVTTLIENIILSIIKLIAGIITFSFSMIADSIHSFSDVFSTIIVMLGIKISNKKADKSHPYGHERFECVSAIILSIMLFITGLYIGVQSITNIINKNFPTNTKLTVVALVIAIISIVTKEAMFWYTKHYAKITNSNALLADAWHHRSDALSSIGSFIGILGVMIGVPVLDSVFGILISLIIIKVSISIFIDSIKKMTDEAVDEITLNKIEQVIMNVNGVISIESLKTRKFANKILIEVEITCSKTLEFIKAHEIAENVEKKVLENINNVKACMVHYDPV